MTEPMRSQVDHCCRSKWVLLSHRSAEGHRRSEIGCLFGKIREELQRILNFKPEKSLGDADRCLKEKDLDSQPRHCRRRQERLGVAVLAKDRRRFAMVFLFLTGPHIARRRKRILPSPETGVSTQPPFAGLAPSELEKTTLCSLLQNRKKLRRKRRQVSCAWVLYQFQVRVRSGQVHLIHAEAQKQRLQKFVVGHGAVGGGRAFLQIVCMHGWV
ncbi:hypothetical protein MRB53_009636 [Persea americana]|uniref:Uncharacterized protein n=1 Tax=Persea americana TaxID=3435 RepID=A0ACC2LQQ6_PERAE|nr:hypothetical protein MRB53_009636 [Persea americana]